MKRGILPIILLLLTGAASAEVAPAPISEESLQECSGSFSDFRQSVSWYQGRNRILIEAKQACGSRIGNLALQDVTVTILAGNKELSKISAADAILSNRKHQLLITAGIAAGATHCIQPGAIMTVNLATGELRTTGTRIILNSSDTPNCRSI